MILLEVDLQGITVLEFEGNAPRAIHVNGIPLWFAVKSVKIKSRNVHILWQDRAIQSVEPTRASSMKCFLNTARFTGFKQLLQALVQEAPDHSYV